MYETRTLHEKSEATSQNDLFAYTVNLGLSLKHKRLPSWLIFDSDGSEIFKKITELAEYLPAACEFEIIRDQKNKISELIKNEPVNLIELGSGDGCKTRILIEHFLGEKIDLHYFPIDISSGAIKNLISSLEKDQKETSLKATGLIGDYFDGINSIEQNGLNLILFLGVTLSNMDPEETHTFLQNLKDSMNAKDYILIGFDIMKDPKLLYSAYNDSKGLFKQFNLHLLDRINQRLGANFNKDNFVQQGQLNPVSRAVESYLYSICDHTVHITTLNKDFHFKAWETLKTEQSYKYTLEEIENLAIKNGFKIVENLFDSRKYFVDSIWKVA